MNKKCASIAVLICLTVVGGCVTTKTSSATEFKVDYNENEVISYRENIIVNRDNYGKCIFTSAYFIKKNYGFDPKRTPILEDCQQFAEEYYKSVYYSTFSDRDDVQESFRIATAKEALALIEDQAFLEAKK